MVAFPLVSLLFNPRKGTLTKDQPYYYWLRDKIASVEIE